MKNMKKRTYLSLPENVASLVIAHLQRRNLVVHFIFALFFTKLGAVVPRTRLGRPLFHLNL